MTKFEKPHDFSLGDKIIKMTEQLNEYFKIGRIVYLKSTYFEDDKF